MARPVLRDFKVLSSGLVSAEAAAAVDSDSTPAIELSPVDHVLTNATFYTALIFDQSLDEELLRSTLQQALVDFPVLAGRLALVQVSVRAAPTRPVRPGSTLPTRPCPAEAPFRGGPQQSGCILPDRQLRQLPGRPDAPAQQQHAPPRLQSRSNSVHLTSHHTSHCRATAT